VHRRLLNLLTLLSLLLCLAVLVLRVASYQKGTWVRWQGSDRVGPEQSFTAVSLLSDRGEVAVVVDRQWVRSDEDIGLLIARADNRDGWRWPGGMFDHLYDSGFESTAGFGAADTRTAYGGTDGSRYAVLMALWWSLAAALGLLPAARLSRRLRLRPKAGCCPSCGYDLRATPGRCPECGALRARFHNILMSVKV
jgi:hypothetical protein